jgi:hypothetical protein
MYLRARLDDSTEVVDHVSLGEANTGITDGEHLVFSGSEFEPQKNKKLIDSKDKFIRKDGVPVTGGNVGECSPHPYPYFSGAFSLPLPSGALLVPSPLPPI